MYCDNQTTRHIVSNLVFSWKNQTYEVDYHFMRENVQSRLIETLFVKSKE
jgi:hypothetical protein